MTQEVASGEARSDNPAAFSEIRTGPGSPERSSSPLSPGTPAHEEIAEAARFPAENPNPVFRVAADGKLLYANRASQSLLEAWQYDSTGGIPALWRERFAEVLAAGAARKWDAQCGERILQLNCVPFAETGYVNVYASDVTERHVAESQKEAALEELRASQARLALELADMQQLQSLSTRLIQQDSIDALWRQILNAAIGLLHSDGGSIQVFDASADELRLLAWQGLAPESAAFWARIDTTSRGVWPAARQKSERIVVPDAETSDVVVQSPDREHFRHSGIRGIQSTPLLARDGRLVGMISTHWRTPHELSDREARLLDVLARQAADLLERAHIQAEREAALGSLLETALALRTARDELEQRVQERTAELAASREELRAYARRVVEATENERRAVAQEVHDEAAQALWALRLGLAALRGRINDDRYAADFEMLEQVVARAVIGVHRLAAYLRPVALYLYGLIPALQQYLNSSRSEIDVEFETTGLEAVRLPAGVEIAIYQVVQEALTNVLLHAQARRVRVLLEHSDGQVLVSIEDDGRGVDAAHASRSEGLGIPAMKERAAVLGGSLTITRGPQRGTTVTLAVPLRNE